MENKRPDQPKQKTKAQSYNRVKRKYIAEFVCTISVFIFIIVFGLISLFLILFPRSTESQIEKRKLATFPQFSLNSYFSGEFTKNVAEFYDDTVPFRDSFKTAGYNFKGIFGLHTEDEVKMVGVKGIDKNKPQPVEASKNETSQKPSEASKADETSKQESQSSKEESKNETSQMGEAEYTVENGIIVVKHNGHYRALELLGGGTGNSYVDALNSFRKDLNDNVRIYSMIAPLASEYYTPSNYSEYTVSQKEVFDSIASRLFISSCENTRLS